MRHLEGIDFHDLNDKTSRNGAYTSKAPTIVSKIVAKENFLIDDYKSAQKFITNPDCHVKATIPGPMTIIDTVANTFYKDEEELAFDLAKAINFEIRHLIANGCKYIQIDEPLFARKPE